MKLVCPHCGHDGTPETTKTSIGSYGFNYLSDEVVYREVQIDPEGGRLLLSSEVKSGGAGSNERVECRSCWQTFAVPDGVRCEIAPPAAPRSEAPAETPAAPDAAGAVPESGGAGPAARIADGLSALVNLHLEEALRPIYAKLGELDAKTNDHGALAERVDEVCADAARRGEQLRTLTEEIEALRGRLSVLETSVASNADGISKSMARTEELAGRQEGIQARAGEIDGALGQLRGMLSASQEELRSWQESHSARLQSLESTLEAVASLSAALREIQTAQQNLQSRLDAQAEAIRVLHLAAQERIQRREELQAALQRLEQIAGALGQPKPLPENM